MRTAALLPLTLLLCGFSATALAEPNTLCDYQLRYDISVDGDSLLMRNAPAAEVRIVGDRLWIGAQPQALSAIERQRLDDYRRELAGFTRKLAQVVRTGVQLGIEHAVLVIAALTGAEDGGQALMRRFDGVRSQLSAHLDGRHLPAPLLGEDFDEALDAAIDQVTEQAVIDMSGDTAQRMAMSLLAPSRLHTRAEHSDELIEARAQQRGRALERQADALCGQLRRLDALENAIGRFNAFDRNAPSV